MLIYVALGSNLEQPLQQLQRACDHLQSSPDIQLTRASRIYKSSPVGPQDQPDFYNAMVAIESTLSPQQLLTQLQHIEQQQQRVRLRHWGPRTIDLDLILYGDHIIQEENLVVPHPRMQERHFVLLPLADLVPNLTLPDGTKLNELIESLDTHDIQPVSAELEV